MKFLPLMFFTIAAIVAEDRPDYYFPDGFVFGASTAATQIEGGWDEDGKGESIYDHYIHEDQTLVADGSNADVACDSYHKYKEDVQMLVDLGVDIYRFSIAWSRILPNGKTDQINQKGIDYYNNLIDELLANNIQPYVTIHHYDLPETLQEEGGWLERKMSDYFVDYARVLFENFGDRVKHWMTINEPMEVCLLGYGLGMSLPYITGKPYTCGHNLLLAHGKTYRLYEEEFKEKQEGQVSIVIDLRWYEPNDTESESDQMAAKMLMEMTYGWFVNPIIYGNYPDLLIEMAPQFGSQTGSNETFPEFTTEEQEMLKGSIDFLGVNHYTSAMVYVNDSGALVQYQPDDWPSTQLPQTKVVPWGMRKSLIYIKEQYGNPPVVITENGFPGNGTIEDYARIDWYKQYLYEVLRAIHEEDCNVVGYSTWSLMDNFEWTEGYTIKYGLYYVDFDNPERPRSRKMSTYVYNNIITTRHVDWDYMPEWPPINSDSN